MKKIILSVFMIIGVVCGLWAQDSSFAVTSFNKIIVSPHIEVNLVEGDQEGVVINNAKVPMDKINVEVEGNVLRLYLDGAKVVTKSERVSNDHWRGSKPLYNGTMVTATITYRELRNLSVRGEEIVRSEGPLKANDFKMSLYGEAKVYLSDVDFDAFTVAIYGSSYLEISKGNINRQVYRAYGESEVNTLGMHADETKITAYGESNFRVNVAERLKVTCYGETNVSYIGDPSVDKGIIIGEAKVHKIG